MALTSAARRSVQALGGLGIVLVIGAMLYALAIGWLNFDRIGV